MFNGNSFLPGYAHLFEKHQDRKEESHGKDNQRDTELSQDEGLIVPHFWKWNWHRRVHHIIFQLAQYPGVL